MPVDLELHPESQDEQFVAVFTTGKIVQFEMALDVLRQAHFPVLTQENTGTGMKLSMPVAPPPGQGSSGVCRFLRRPWGMPGTCSPSSLSRSRPTRPPGTSCLTQRAWKPERTMSPLSPSQAVPGGRNLTGPALATAATTRRESSTTGLFLADVDVDVAPQSFLFNICSTSFLPRTTSRRA